MTSQRATGRGRARAARLVAHRGYARHYPENTMAAVDGAWRAGVHRVEVDVQITADGVPVLFHDLELYRTTGAAGRIIDTPFERLAALPAGEPQRFGTRFADARIPALTELTAGLAARPDTRAFIELKRESLEAFGVEAALARVIAGIEPVRDRCVLISSERDAMAYARTHGAARIGWVLRAYDAASLAAAAADRPDFLFLNHTRLPSAPEALRTGPWRWVLYEIDDAVTATRLITRGADMIETMAIGELLADPAWCPDPDDAG